MDQRLEHYRLRNLTTDQLSHGRSRGGLSLSVTVASSQRPERDALDESKLTHLCTRKMTSDPPVAAPSRQLPQVDRTPGPERCTKQPACAAWQTLATFTSLPSHDQFPCVSLIEQTLFRYYLLYAELAIAVAQRKWTRQSALAASVHTEMPPRRWLSVPGLDEG